MGNVVNSLHPAGSLGTLGEELLPDTRSRVVAGIL